MSRPTDEAPAESMLTLEQPETKAGRGDGGAPVPGAIVVWSGTAPVYLPFAIPDGGIAIGRLGAGAHPLDDAAASRQHTRISFEGGQFQVADLGSRNGTFVNGKRVGERTPVRDSAIVRLGTSLVMLVRDARHHLAGTMEQGDSIRGPTLALAHEQVRAAARGQALHVTGASGAGKELAARLFHTAGPNPGGPFVAINCATIPNGVAERLLFGARKGAFSGATADADGHVQSADGGTLFLDEIAELDLEVQAKLLRVLETREVLQLGATRPRKVELRVCSATHRGLRELVRAGAFREDLYFRLGRPEVPIPSLYERREEIPFFVHRVLARLGLRARPSFVTVCMRRRWPGNVRELLAEVEFAAHAAARAGATELDDSHLSPTAGMPVTLPVREPSADVAPDGRPAADARVVPARLPSRDELVASLVAQQGNLSRAAAVLGIHRSQLRRMIERHAIDLHAYRPGGGK
ncbi:MAG TPA: sigma 54-interacting transcriptional regulator [Kofleriaceae bacterium]|nr:sigma 54-interacting transcriptional regulator [Kofleriaceae bacterium]